MPDESTRSPRLGPHHTRKIMFLCDNLGEGDRAATQWPRGFSHATTCRYGNLPHPRTNRVSERPIVEVRARPWDPTRPYAFD